MCSHAIEEGDLIFLQQATSAWYHLPLPSLQFPLLSVSGAEKPSTRQEEQEEELHSATFSPAEALASTYDDTTTIASKTRDAIVVRRRNICDIT